MDTKPEATLSGGWGVAAALLSGLLLYFGTGLHPWWPLAWLAPLPVLLAALRLPPRPAFGCAGLAWLLGGLNLWTYLRQIIGVPLPLALLAVVVPAGIFALSVRLFRALARQGLSGWAVLALPAAWVAYEYLNAAVSPHGTFLNLAYSQMSFLPILQIAAVTGIWGIGFLLMLLPASIAALAAPGIAARRRRRLAIVTGSVFAAVLLFCVIRLQTRPKTGTTILAGAAASDLPQFQWPTLPAQQARVLRQYATQAVRLAPAQVIVFPEKIAPVNPGAMAPLDQLFQAAARQAQASIVVGILHRSGSSAKALNQARVYCPAGALAATYDKHHLVPILEGDEQPGHDLTVLDEPSGRWGIEICKDMDFPRLSRRYGAAGVGLLLIPAWDFARDGWLHDRMAVLRGVENGFSIVRAARDGELTVSDDRGHILAQTSSRAAAPFSRLTARVPVRHDVTLYTLWGDWFAWLNLAALAAVLAKLCRTKRNFLDTIGDHDTHTRH